MLHQNFVFGLYFFFLCVSTYSGRPRVLETLEIAIDSENMNVTEKQKQIMINFMKAHPDFGKGRLRYNRENKRKLVSTLISYLKFT